MEDFLKRNDAIRFAFKKYLLAAVWRMDYRGKCGSRESSMRLLGESDGYGLDYGCREHRKERPFQINKRWGGQRKVSMEDG